MRFFWSGSVSVCPIFAVLRNEKGGIHSLNNGKWPFLSHYSEVVDKEVAEIVSDVNCEPKCVSDNTKVCCWWGALRMVAKYPLCLLDWGQNTEIPKIADEEETMDNLVVFRDRKAIATYHRFLGYVPDRPDPTVETTVSSLAFLDEWICTFTSLLSPREQRCGGRQN